MVGLVALFAGMRTTLRQCRIRFAGLTQHLQTQGPYGDIQTPINYDTNGFALAINNYGLHDTALIGWQGDASNDHMDTFDCFGQVNPVPGVGSLQPTPTESDSPNYTSSADWYSSVVATVTAEVDLFTQCFGDTGPFLEQCATANMRVKRCPLSVSILC
jgi:hypothetical protein